MESTSADFAAEHNPPHPDIATVASGDEALSALIQQALDELATALQQPEQVAQSIIDQVVKLFAKGAKSADKSQQQLLELIIADLLASLQQHETLTDAILAPILAEVDKLGLTYPASGLPYGGGPSGPVYYPPGTPLRPYLPGPGGLPIATGAPVGLPPALTSTPQYPVSLPPGAYPPGGPYSPGAPTPRGPDAVPSPGPIPSPGGPSPIPPPSPGAPGYPGGPPSPYTPAGGVTPLPTDGTVGGPPAPTMPGVSLTPPAVPGEPPRPGESVPPPPPLVPPPPDTAVPPSFARPPESGVEPPASGAPWLPGDVSWIPGRPNPGGEVCPAACEGGDPLSPPDRRPGKVQVGAAGAERPDGGDCGDWCDDMRRARVLFIAIGEKVVAGGDAHLTDDALAAGAALAKLESNGPQLLRDAMNSVLSDPYSLSMARRALQASTIHYSERKDDLLALLACRALFDALASFGVGWGRTIGEASGSSGGVGGSVGVSAGASLGQGSSNTIARSKSAARSGHSSGSISGSGGFTLGLGASTTGTHGGTASASWSIGIWLVPLSSVLDQCILWAMPTAGLSTGAAIALWVRGRITEAHARCAAEHNGDSWCEVRQEAYTARSMLSPKDAIEYAKRIGAKPNDAMDYLRHLGYMTDQEQIALLTLYHPLPTTTEYLHHWSSGMADPNYAAKVDGDEDFLAGFWGDAQADAEAAGMTEERAKLLWRAHWRTPGINERRNMLWRLRPGAVPPAVEFTDQDYRTALAADALPQYWRDREYELRYRVPATRQLAQLLDSGAVTLDEVHSTLLSEGFSPEWARRFLDFERIHSYRRHQAEIEGWTPARLSSAYAAGCVDAETVRNTMLALSFTVADADALMQTATALDQCRERKRWAEKSRTMAMGRIESGFKLGNITQVQAHDALRALGADFPAAQGIVAAWELEETERRNTAARRAVRKGWSSGYVGDAAAHQLLVRTGMSPTVAAAEVAEWVGERMVDARVGDAQETLRLMVEGVIAPPVAAARLHQMGWQPDEAELLLQEARNKLRQASVKADAAQARGRIQAGKAAQQLVRETRQAHKQAMAELKRLWPLGTLRRWLKTGVINEANFRDRLQLLGYTQEIIDKHVAEVCAMKGAKCGEGTESAVNGAAGGGGGGGGLPPAGGGGA